MSWSDELKELTRKALRDGAPTLDGSLALNNIDGRFGLMSLEDQLAGRMAVTDRRSGVETRYPDAETLIADGWAVD